jgi:hypothetical protein
VGAVENVCVEVDVCGDAFARFEFGGRARAVFAAELGVAVVVGEVFER